MTSTTGDRPRVHPTAILGDDVTLPEDVEAQNHVEVGVQPRDLEPTRIGAGSTIRSHTVLYRGTTIGSGFQTGHGAMVREGNTIGDGCSVGTHSVVERDSILGDGVRIHTNCFVPEFVTLEDGAWIGPGTTILNTPHPPCPEFEHCAKGIPAEGVTDERVHGVVIGRNAKVGGNVTIGPWVHVGEDALVGAGSVVLDDVPPRTVVAGNPAREIRKVDELACRAGYFDTPYEWERDGNEVDEE